MGVFIIFVNWLGIIIFLVLGGVFFWRFFFPLGLSWFLGQVVVVNIVAVSVVVNLFFISYLAQRRA